MEIICGKDKINVKDVEKIEFRKAKADELEKIERETNGELIAPEKQFGLTFKKKFNEIIDEYNIEIADRLAAPQLCKADLPSYRMDENMDAWKYQNHGKCSFSLVDFDNEGDGTIIWKFKIEHIEEKTVLDAQRNIKLGNIMQVIENLTNIQKSKIIEVFSLKHITKEIFDIVLLAGNNTDDKEYVNHSYKQIQNDLPPIYAEYENAKEKIQERLKIKKDFLNMYKDKFVLIISLKDSTQKTYLETFCGFDIFSIFN